MAYKVKVVKKRPDYRVFIDLLYGFEHNVDTDGDSIPVNSRSWTFLYIKDRMSNEPFVLINVENLDTSMFEIKSASKRLEELSALYLFEYCGSSIEHDGEKIRRETILKMKEIYQTELDRAYSSIWHYSSDKTPYPNLESYKR